MTIILKWWHFKDHSYQGGCYVYEWVEVAEEKLSKSLSSAWDKISAIPISRDTMTRGREWLLWRVWPGKALSWEVAFELKAEG